MIRKSYPWLLFLAGIIIGLVASGHLVLLAQDQAGGGPSKRVRPVDEDIATRTARPADPSDVDNRPKDRAGLEGNASSPTVQDVLLRPYRFAFPRPTPLSQVCTHLKQTLNVPVVLDLAALGRQDVQPEDPVQLELDGARLKTGLKLLLDQVGLTYHVVTEDNLLVITDLEGSEDPLDRVWSELRALHRDLHDVQDAIDDLTGVAADENVEGPRVRKPTIIEEMPENAAPKAEAPGESPPNSAKSPKGAQRPAPAPRSTPARVPLGGDRRSL